MREAISMGVDEGFLVLTVPLRFRYLGYELLTLGAIKKGAYSILLSAVSRLLMETRHRWGRGYTHLNIPQVTYVKKVEEATDKMMRLERMLEEGYWLETPLPRF